MGWWQNIGNRASDRARRALGLPSREAFERLETALSEAVRNRGGVGSDYDFLKFRSALSTSAPWDYTAQPEFARIAKNIVQLYFHNPLARRIVEIMKSFIIGDGYEAESDDENVSEWLDKYMSDPLVDFRVMSEKWCNDSLIIGELCLEPEINEVSGKCLWSPLDCSRTQKIYMKYGRPWVIDIQKVDPADVGLKTLELAHIDIDPSSSTYGKMVGDAVLYQINATTLFSRGYSILKTLADWLMAYDEFLFNELSRAMAMRKFLIDCEIQGATPAVIADYKNTYKSVPDSGTVMFHNEKEKWTFTSPNLESFQAGELASNIRNQIYAGAGLAEHWMAEGGDVNRATASEMSKPIIRKLKDYQAAYLRFLETVLTFARDQAVIAGALVCDVNDSATAIRVIGDQIDPDDESVEWDIVTKVINSMTVAVTGGIATQDEARAALKKYLSELGIETEENGADVTTALNAAQAAHQDNEAHQNNEAKNAEFA